MKSAVFEEYLEKVRNAYEYNKTGFPKDCDTFEDTDNCFLDAIDNDSPIFFEAGVTKGCILSTDETNYVLKVPFCQAWNDWDDEYDQFEGAFMVNKETGEFIFDNGNFNYCYLEAYLSDVFIKEGLGDCICKEELFEDIDGFPIYIQERATISYGEEEYDRSYYDANGKYAIKYRYSEEERDNYISSTDKKYKKFATEFALDFINYHGLDKFIKVIDIIDRFGVNDMHHTNYGYIGDRPVLIDYSGYRETDRRDEEA